MYEHEDLSESPWTLLQHLQACLIRGIPTDLYPPHVRDEINNILPYTLTPLPVV